MQGAHGAIGHTGTPSEGVPIMRMEGEGGSMLLVCTCQLAINS